MFRTIKKQVSLAEVIISHDKCYLDEIDSIIDWNPIEKRIEALYVNSPTGRPAYPVIMMFKILLLQAWNKMSDQQAEYSLNDRLSFRRFIGLSLDEHAPDHSTIHRFRDRITMIIDELFSEINRQLSAHEVMVREVTMVDASLVKAAVRPPRTGLSSSDPDARWGGKGEDQMIYGYKAHVGMDKDSELIHSADLSPANEHDSQHFATMLSGDEAIVFADKGYCSAANSAILAERDISDGIMRKSSRGHPLPSYEVDINRFISSIRCGVERFFGTMKRIYGFSRCRYFNIRRNRCHLLLVCMCYNLRRSLKLLSV